MRYTSISSVSKIFFALVQIFNSISELIDQFRRPKYADLFIWLPHENLKIAKEGADSIAQLQNPINLKYNLWISFIAMHYAAIPM